MPVINKPHYKGLTISEIISQFPNTIYIGRPSIWGNPYVIGKDGTREEVLQKYKQYLGRKIKSGEISIRKLASLYGKNLLCSCAPRPCHGDILEKAATWAHNKINKK